MIRHYLCIQTNFQLSLNANHIHMCGFAVTTLEYELVWLIQMFIWKNVRSGRLGVYP